MTTKTTIGALALVTALCAGARQEPLDLNGSWEFALAEGKTLENAGGPDFAATDRMSVPGCWDMQPKCLCKRGTGLYRRTFTLAEPVENAWIVVDGMGLRAMFAIDGKQVGGIQPYPWARLEIPTGPLGAGVHTVFAAVDNVLDWNLEGQDKFIEDLEQRRKAVLDFVNGKVSKFSKIKDVEIRREPFSKTATHKIRRFLYEKAKQQ